jgi:tryptophan halogenase
LVESEADRHDWCRRIAPCRRSGTSIVSLQIDEQGVPALGCWRTSNCRFPFENWRRTAERFIHPFGITGQSTLACGFHHFWLDSLRRGMQSDLATTAWRRWPRAATGSALRAIAAGQLLLPPDAGLYARFLRSKAESYGLRRVEGKIREVRQNGESGYVEALVLDDGQVIGRRPVSSTAPASVAC